MDAMRRRGAGKNRKRGRSTEKKGKKTEKWKETRTLLSTADPTHNINQSEKREKGESAETSQRSGAAAFNGCAPVPAVAVCNIPILISPKYRLNRPHHTSRNFVLFIAGRVIRGWGSIRFYYVSNWACFFPAVFRIFFRSLSLLNYTCMHCRVSLSIQHGYSIQ